MRHYVSNPREEWIQKVLEDTVHFTADSSNAHLVCPTHCISLQKNSPSQCKEQNLPYKLSQNRRIKNAHWGVKVEKEKWLEELGG